MTLSAVGIALLLIFLGRQLVFATTMLHGPVFVPSKDDKLKTMIKLAKPKKSDRILDLGSGDGKIVIKLAKLGLKADGIEINPILVRKSQKIAEKLGLENLANFKKGNFWNQNYSKYDLIFWYGTTYVMNKLEKKLLAELKPGARIVSNYFQFPNWKPTTSENEVRLYVKL